jgi:uncharacterized protein (DUF305 family)
MLRTACACLAIVSVVAVSGCSEPEKAPSPVRTAADGTVFNDADASFATELIEQRAEEMALIDLTTGRELSGPLATFVEGARDVRTTDVESATTWLTDWDLEVPTTVRDHAASHEGGQHHDFEDQTGAPFEEAWVEAFLAELEDTDDLAREEQAEGRYAEAIALAEQVEASADDESDVLEDLAP